MYDFEDVNRILSEMQDNGMVEPIDDPSIQTDFHDWAEVVGVVDDFAPQVMIDDNGRPWYVY
jgi:hypothetical protein